MVRWFLVAILVATCSGYHYHAAVTRARTSRRTLHAYVQHATTQSATQNTLPLPLRSSIHASAIQSTPLSSLSTALRALAVWLAVFRDRFALWIADLIPFDWIVRRAVRWLAFSASAEQIRFLKEVCQGAAPIAEGALQAAELRETYARAREQGVYTPQLQAEVVDASKFLEDATEQALAQMPNIAI